MRFTGFEIGNSFTHCKLKEDEIKQGKNYYMSAAPLAGQAFSFINLNERLISHIPHRGFRNSARVLSITSSLLLLPSAFFLAACVKHSQYDALASKLKQASKGYLSSFLITKLPNQLSNRTVKVINFLADHAGDMMQIAMITGGLALIVLGQTFFGGGLLISLVYGTLDGRGWVPRKVSLFTETYSPIIGTVGAFYTGTWFIKTLATLNLVTTLFSNFKILLQKKLDSSLSRYLNISAQVPSIEEIDKSFNGSKNLTYQEIKNVVNARGNQKYEINIPHCTNFVKAPNLPKDYDFNKLLQFFKSIDWTQKFNVIKIKLSNEDRFLAFLSEKHVNVPPKDLKKNIDFYIESLAKIEGISKEKYAANWLNEQMLALVDVFTGNKRGKGSQKDLQDAINICPEIVAYLQQIGEDLGDIVEYEDALLKMALEAGNYCNRGIKRVFSEMQSQIIYKKSSNVQHEENDWIKQYELQFLQSLQDLRYKIILATYQTTTGPMLRNEISQDTHTFDLYRNFFSFGFYPFTEYERTEFGLLNSIIWKTKYSGFIKEMYVAYQSGLFNKIEENGNESNYILYKIIEQNPNLKDSQKEELRNWYGDVDAEGDSKDIEIKSRLLLLMTMGVLQPKTTLRSSLQEI